MSTNPFPILHLPESALRKSINQISLMDQFSLSVLSSKTKHIVTMLTAVKNNVSITMASSLQLDISNKFKSVEFLFKMDPHYQSVKIHQRFNNGSNTSTELSIPGFTVKHWIEHIVHVFCKARGVMLTKHGNPTREHFAKLCEIIKNIKIVHLEVYSLKSQNFKRLKLFPCLEWLIVLGMGRAPIQTPMLIQNIQGLHLVLEIRWKINDVLISNFSQFIMRQQRFSVQDLSLFMRQWINGSMPRLEVFHATFTHYDEHKLVETDLFKGIKYTVKDNEYSKTVEIERKDGAKASVNFEEQRSSLFRFSVKSEHD